MVTPDPVISNNFACVLLIYIKFKNKVKYFYYKKFNSITLADSGIVLGTAAANEDFFYLYSCTLFFVLKSSKDKKTSLLATQDIKSQGTAFRSHMVFVVLLPPN